MRTTTKRVKRWRDQDMAVRRCAAGFIEAEKSFRKIDGVKDLGVLETALLAGSTSLPRGSRKMNHTAAGSNCERASLSPGRNALSEAGDGLAFRAARFCTIRRDRDLWRAAFQHLHCKDSVFFPREKCLSAPIQY